MTRLHTPIISPSKDNTAVKIVVLWTVFLLGTLFHTQLALMPLFHGLNVASSHTHEVAGLNAVMWFMLAFFTLPLLAMMGCMFIPSLRFRRVHFAMTLLYTVLNLVHLVMDEIVSVPGYQLMLMFLLLLVGILLNLVSYQWMKRLARSETRLELSR